MCRLPQPRGLQEVCVRRRMVLQPSLPEARLGLFRRTSPGSLPAASIQRHLQLPQHPQQSARSHSVFHHQISNQGSPVNGMGKQIKGCSTQANLTTIAGPSIRSSTGISPTVVSLHTLGWTVTAAMDARPTYPWEILVLPLRVVAALRA
jgi:hypothetical protein